MDKDATLTIIELIISILIEGVILAGVFTWISNKAQNRSEQKLNNEMNNIEKQNKFDFEQTMTAINQARLDIISEIKESSTKK